MSDDEIQLGRRGHRLASVLERCLITAGVGPTLELEQGIGCAMAMLLAAKKSGASIYLIGNGGSAGVASHAAIDFLNVAKLRASTLHESSLLTCAANDYGYENAFSRLLSVMARPGDILIAISSSGRSMNIRNAVAQMKAAGGAVITLSGFAADNPLRSSGDLNMWLDSMDYGLVEVGHQFILHNLSDRFGAGLAEAASA